MSLFNSMGLLGVFLSSVLAATILPFSSEAVLSAYLLKGDKHFFAISLATIGNTCGGMINYYMGNAGKLKWASKWLKISKKDVLMLQQRVQEWGSLLAFFTWLPVIGDPLALALGYFKVNLVKVFLYMILGKALRYLTLFYLLDFIRPFF